LNIHPTAIVSKKAEIGENVLIGPYCVINDKVKIGSNTKLDSHIVVGSKFGSVYIGKRNFIESGATLGGPPQHYTYQNREGSLIIGNDNRIGEKVSISLGSKRGEGKTIIGNKTFIMTYAHIGHDSEIQDEAIITNLTQIAGHVLVGKKAIISGMVPITQFVNVGELSFISANSKVNKDIIPFVIADGEWAIPKAINKIGLNRASVSKKSINNIEKALKIILTPKHTIKEALKRINTEIEPCLYIENLTQFIEKSKKGIARK
tara:strand:- start:102690 stop:103475 length:786 start_codon:yes stop_codon:yes gene_type:complete